MDGSIPIIGRDWKRRRLLHSRSVMAKWFPGFRECLGCCVLPSQVSAAKSAARNLGHPTVAVRYSLSEIALASAQYDIRQLGKCRDLPVRRLRNSFGRLSGAVAPQDVESRRFSGIRIPAIRRQEADAAGRDVESLGGQPVNGRVRLINLH